MLVMVMLIAFDDGALRRLFPIVYICFITCLTARKNKQHESSCDEIFVGKIFRMYSTLNRLHAIVLIDYTVCFSSLSYAVLIVLITILIFVACKKHTKHQASFEQNQSYIGHPNNYDDASIATGLSDSGDEMKMMELKRSILTPAAEPIYDSVGEGSTGVHLPSQHVALAQSKPELPRPRFSPSSLESPQASPTKPLFQPSISVGNYSDPLPPPIDAIPLESSYSDAKAKPYMVPVVRSYEEVANPAYDHVDVDDDGYMKTDAQLHGYMDMDGNANAGIDPYGYMKMKSEEKTN